MWKKSLFMLIVVPGHTKKNEIGRGRMGVTTADPVLFRPLHRKYDGRGNLKAELKVRKGAAENKRRASL